MTMVLLNITRPPPIRAITSSVTCARMYFVGVHSSLLTKTTPAWAMHTCIGLLEVHKPGLLEAHKPGLLEARVPGPLEMHKPGMLEVHKPGMLEVHKPGLLEAWVGLKVKKAKGELHEVRVEGLETLDYLENMKKRECFTEQGDATTFEEICLIIPTKFAILDHERKRTFVIRKDGLPDAVLWIPWDEKAKALADFGDDEYKHMLVDPLAAAIEKPITLKPGEEWRGRREIFAVPSSYCSGQLDPQKVVRGI